MGRGGRPVVVLSLLFALALTLAPKHGLLAGRHARREAGYARDAMKEFMKAVYRQMRLISGFEVMNRTIEISQAALMRHTLAAYPPDLLIEVPRTVCRSLEFYRASEVIEIGHELACAALDSLDLPD